MNRMNLFNEGVLLIISLMLPFFIEVSIGKDAFNAAGWVLCILLGT